MLELDGALRLVKDAISPVFAVCCYYLVAVVSSIDGHEAAAEFRDLLPLVVSLSLT